MALVGPGMSPYMILVASRAVRRAKAHVMSYDAHMVHDNSSNQQSNIQT